MIVSYVCQHVGPALWHHQQLASTIPQALISNLEVMQDHHMKIFLRHALTPLLTNCPVPVRPPWLLPVLSKLLPFMHDKLAARWRQVLAMAAANDASSSSSGQHQQQQQQLSDDIVLETLLREVTREYTAMLAKTAERKELAAAAAAGGAAAASSNGPTGAGGGGSSSSNGNAAAAHAAAAAAIAGFGADQQQAAQSQLQQQESIVQSLWRYDVKAMQALIATAVQGMCWPDGPSAQKCTVVCR
jgi:hypothetical protein